MRKEPLVENLGVGNNGNARASIAVYNGALSRQTRRATVRRPKVGAIGEMR